jgi:hypothetical protein
MNNVDIEIYMTTLVKFFTQNPDQLKLLIGDNDGSKFYQKIREIAEKNQKEEKEIAPTRNQMIQVILEIQNKVKKNTLNNVVSNFIDHHMGKISLN